MVLFSGMLLFPTAAHVDPGPDPDPDPDETGVDERLSTAAGGEITLDRAAALLDLVCLGDWGLRGVGPGGGKSCWRKMFGKLVILNPRS